MPNSLTIPHTLPKTPLIKAAPPREIPTLVRTSELQSLGHWEHQS
ncbi:hypothetical protein [Acinetobacter phage Ab69]|nr:hypothetical protein [Acinetobacter phage Ab69]